MMYLDDYFLCDPALIRPRPTMMEIGVFTIEKAVKFHESYPQVTAVLIEPDPENFDKLWQACGPYAWTFSLRYALADQPGVIPFYRYGHEQWHSTFPRHVREDMKLVEVVQVRACTLAGLLDVACLDVCDLLLLNCEGAEIHAMRQLADDPDLRARVPQFCTSFHCDHVKIYPPVVRDNLMAALAPYYTATRGAFEPIPYWHFGRRV